MGEQGTAFNLEVMIMNRLILSVIFTTVSMSLCAQEQPVAGPLRATMKTGTGQPSTNQSPNIDERIKNHTPLLEKLVSAVRTNAATNAAQSKDLEKRFQLLN